MNKRHDEAVELAGIIQNKMCYENYIFSDVAAIDAADEILNLGYYKPIWHKVSDGDLPKKHKEVVVFLDVNYDYYIGSYAKNDGSFHTYIGFDMDKSKVIAWTELPKYEEK